MNVRLKPLAEQLLFALNIFIAFLLLFEDRLVIPSWLQSVGRMHPLVLHFPIVLLAAAALMELFPITADASRNAACRRFSRNLLLSGTLTTAVTVVMGLFLSKEEGYTGETLLRHKWTGAGLFFITSLIYFSGNKTWYRAPMAKTGALLAMTALIVTGHYGASLTHGENFILGPLTRNETRAAVPPEQAIVFDHVILPILQEKCASCHNPDKIKGGLLLTDAQSLLKGGKSGRLFISGNPEMSLLLQRVHMPLEEKKHMPPAGKPQLTVPEMQLLAAWIKSGGDFRTRVAALAPGDSLRTLAMTRLEARLEAPSETEEGFDFPAADAETVAKLNHDYRTVAPLAGESPALSVSFYNPAAFSSSQLGELDPVGKQIVSLNLNKMPVGNADLKYISKFENLRKLSLNFTDITADGLADLAALKHLHTLTISGTKTDYKGLASKLPLLKALKTLSVWETGLSASDVRRLQDAHKGLLILDGYRDDGTNPLKLSPPLVSNRDFIFHKDLRLQLRHPVTNVTIRFSTDGTDPDSVHSPVFDGNTVLTTGTTVKAKAFKEGWLASDVAVFEFFRSAYVPDSVRLLAPPDPLYRAEGNKTFFNHKTGKIGPNNPALADHWAGFSTNDLNVLASFRKPVPVSSVGIHHMNREAAGIYPPEFVEIWGGTDENNLRLLSKYKVTMPAPGDPPALVTSEARFGTQTVSFLKIVAKPLHSVPGNPARRPFLLVDEIFIN